MKRLMFVTTLWGDDALASLQFQEGVEVAMPRAMHYVRQRRVKYSFHTIDLLRDDGGVAIEEVAPMVPQIVRAVE